MGGTRSCRDATHSHPCDDARAGHEIADHIASVVHKQLTRLSQSKAFESAQNPVEALHDLRVASRQLRAFVNVFEPLLDPDSSRRAKRILRKITRTVRAVRDWDVQLDLLRERFALASTDIERIALEDLIAVSTSQRHSEARRAHKRLRRIDVGEVRTTLGIAITHLPPPGLPTLQWSWERLQPFAQSKDLNCPPNDGLEHAESLHQLRIRLKKLRYALALFEPALGTAFERLFAPVKVLQVLLGQHHDRVVLTELIHNHRGELQRCHRNTLARTLGTLEERLMEERRALTAEFRRQSFDPESWRRNLRTQLEVSAQSFSGIDG